MCREHCEKKGESAATIGSYVQEVQAARCKVQEKRVWLVRYAVLEFHFAAACYLLYSCMMSL